MLGEGTGSSKDKCLEALRKVSEGRRRVMPVLQDKQELAMQKRQVKGTVYANYCSRTWQKAFLELERFSLQRQGTLEGWG